MIVVSLLSDPSRRQIKMDYISSFRLRVRGVKLDVQAHPWQVDAKTLKYLNDLRMQPT